MIKKTRSPELFRKIVDIWGKEVYGYAFIATGRDKERATKFATEIFVGLWNDIVARQYTEPVDRWIRLQIRKRAVEMFRNSKAKEGEAISHG